MYPAGGEDSKVAHEDPELDGRLGSDERGTTQVEMDLPGQHERARVLRQDKTPPPHTIPERYEPVALDASRCHSHAQLGGGGDEICAGLSSENHVSPAAELVEGHLPVAACPDERRQGFAALGVADHELLSARGRHARSSRWYLHFFSAHPDLLLRSHADRL